MTTVRGFGGHLETFYTQNGEDFGRAFKDFIGWGAQIQNYIEPTSLFGRDIINLTRGYEAMGGSVDGVFAIHNFTSGVNHLFNHAADGLWQQSFVDTSLIVGSSTDMLSFFNEARMISLSASGMSAVAVTSYIAYLIFFGVKSVDRVLTIENDKWYEHVFEALSYIFKFIMICALFYAWMWTLPSIIVLVLSTVATLCTIASFYYKHGGRTISNAELNSLEEEDVDVLPFNRQGAARVSG